MKVALLGLMMLGSLEGFTQGYDSLPNLPEYYQKRAAAFRAEPAKSAKIIFLGNSITEGGKWRSLLKDSSVLNRGISGDNTFGVLARLDEVTRHKPSKVFLLIGVNDLSKKIPNSVILQNIFSIVGRIHSESPKTQVYVQSIFPVNTSHKKFPPAFAHSSGIEEINGQLNKYQEALKYIYVDLFSQFLDGSHQLDVKYSTDGVHLNAAGYVQWVNYLKKQKWV